MDEDLGRGGAPARVLLIEADPRAAVMLGEMLRAAWRGGLVLSHAERVSDGARELGDHGATCALLDLDGLVSEGPDALEQLRASAPDVAVVVLSSGPDEEAGVQVVKAGAQDHLIKSELTPALLGRAVRYAIERKRAEVELAYRALHDPLTGLPNRALFLDRLGVALDRSQRIRNAIAVLFLDLDDFKEVNDSLGHGAGDALLIALADRLRAMLRPMDTVARLGGDEFTFLFEQLTSREEAELIAERIAHTTSRPILLEQGEVTVTVSIGISMVEDPSAAAEDVLREADAAMYHAKELGGGRFALYDEAWRRRTAQRAELEDGLRRALELSELRVHYQPRVSLNGGTSLVGFEALVRWQHPERGLLAPGEFIQVAEESGLILPIGEFVVEQALRQLGRWRRLRPEMTISVNLSPRQLADAELAPRLWRMLRASGTGAGGLGLEVSESAVEQDPERMAEVLGALKDLGVSLAIDDFGLGHSSLSGLKDLPIDSLKLHQSFVGELSRQASQAALVGAVVELGHALGLGVEAEGVETDEQLSRLRTLGFDRAQGFLFSRPIPEDEVERALSGG